MSLTATGICIVSRVAARLPHVSCGVIAATSATSRQIITTCNCTAVMENAEIGPDKTLVALSVLSLHDYFTVIYSSLLL